MFDIFFFFVKCFIFIQFSHAHYRYSDTNLELLCTMLHVAIRGLNSLGDLEVLQIFVEKYFNSTVENRNSTLLDVLHFEEEILRQKISWREKYEGVISGWMSPRAEKIKQNLDKIDKTETKTQDGQSEDKNKPAAGSGVEQAIPGTASETVQTESDTPSPAVVIEPKTTGESQSAGNKQEVAENSVAAVVENSPAAPEEKAPVAEAVGNTASAEVKPADQTATTKR